MSCCCFTYKFIKCVCSQTVNFYVIIDIKDSVYCIVFAFETDLLLDVLVPVLCSSVSKDYIWCRVCERVFTGVPSLSMESVIIPLLSKIPWWVSLEVFGESKSNTNLSLVTLKLTLHDIDFVKSVSVRLAISVLPVSMGRCVCVCVRDHSCVCLYTRGLGIRAASQHKIRDYKNVCW